jgi:hypothetical protein
MRRPPQVCVVTGYPHGRGRRRSLVQRGGSHHRDSPLLGVYKPIWKYDLETLRKDLSAHLVFGTATAAAFCLLADGVDK